MCSAESVDRHGVQSTNMGKILITKYYHKEKHSPVDNLGNICSHLDKSVEIKNRV